jgi:carbamoyl-phosphate synthase large subunit
MRSTGEVMGVATTTSLAFSKSQTASGFSLPASGRVFISVKDDDKPAAVQVARRLRNLGFTLVATSGTAEILESARIPVDRINKVLQGSPHVVDAIREGTVQLVINTTQETKAIRDSYSIRRGALLSSIPYFTTIAAGLAVVDALEVRALLGRESKQVRSLQEWHARSRNTPPVKSS